MKEGIGKKQYILAAHRIISEEGLGALSIRRLGKALDCNTANLYRYFDGLDELIMYAALGYLRDYLFEISTLIQQEADSINRYFGIWECFAKHAFANTSIFNLLFFSKHNFKLYIVMKEYYNLFPEEVAGLGDLQTLFMQGDFDYREYLLLDDCVKRGRIEENDAVMLNQISINLFKGFFKKVLDLDLGPTERVAEQEKFLHAQRFVFRPFILGPERPDSTIF